MNTDTDTFPVKSLPMLLDKTMEIQSYIRTLSYIQARKLWNCNDNLARLNYERHQNMDLRPFDGVTPYRLEMQAKARVKGTKDLYAFWGDSLYRCVTDGDPVILNLASGEYAKCIKAFARPDDIFITCVFGEKKDGKIVQKGTQAKMARGEMVRYLAEGQIETTEQIKDFRGLGYSFEENLSSEKA